MEIIKEILGKIPDWLLLTILIICILLIFGFIISTIFVIIKGRSLKMWGLEIGNKNPDNSLGFTSSFTKNNNQTSLQNYIGVYEVFHLAPHTERVAKAAFEIGIKEMKVGFQFIHPLFEYNEGRYKIAMGNVFVTLFGKENGIEMNLILKEPVGKFEYIWGICTGLSERNEPVAVEVCLKKTAFDSVKKIEPSFIDRASIPQEIITNLNNITV